MCSDLREPDFDWNEVHEIRVIQDLNNWMHASKMGRTYFSFHSSAVILWHFFYVFFHFSSVIFSLFFSLLLLFNLFWGIHLTNNGQIVLFFWTHLSSNVSLLFWPCGVLMHTELIISWIHQYNLLRTFPHIWRRKNNREKKRVRKWKEHNTMIWTWLWNLLCTLDIPVLFVIIVKTTPFGFLLAKKKGRVVDLPCLVIQLQYVLCLCALCGECGNQFWELWRHSFHI